MELIPFLSTEQVRRIQKEFGTPVYVYDQVTLEEQADRVMDFPNAFGLIARYAMKACPSAAVLRVLTNRGLHIDASSGYEAERAIRAGVPGERIQITTQQVPGNLGELIDIHVTEQDSGVVNVAIGGEFLVFRGTRRAVESKLISTDGLATSRVQFSDNQSPLGIGGGELHGIYEARDTILGGFLTQLDTFAATLAHEFNKVYSQGYCGI